MLTAAHCLCSYSDEEPNSRYLCLVNVPPYMEDQQRQDINVIELRVGNQDFTQGSEIAINGAFVMNTVVDSQNQNRVIIHGYYDIGMIITASNILKAPGKPIPMLLPSQ